MASENQQNAPSIEVQHSVPTMKTNWPEVVGLTAEEVEKKIKEEMPRATIQVIPHDSFVTMDFKSNRVRTHHSSLLLGFFMCRLGVVLLPAVLSLTKLDIPPIFSTLLLQQY
nr:subtilisin inhibitor-like [Tanacetum cinerariifolium]